MDEENLPSYYLYNGILWIAVSREITLHSSCIEAKCSHNENSLLFHLVPEEFSVWTAVSIFTSIPLILEARGCYRYTHCNLRRFSNQYRGVMKPVISFWFLAVLNSQSYLLRKLFQNNGLCVCMPWFGIRQVLGFLIQFVCICILSEWRNR